MDSFDRMYVCVFLTAAGTSECMQNIRWGSNAEDTSNSAKPPAANYHQSCVYCSQNQHRESRHRI